MTTLEKSHIEIYRHIKSFNGQPSITNFFGNIGMQGKFSSMNLNQRKEECLDLIICTYITFSILDEPQFENFVSYFA